jgi:hypothetical protein
LLVIVVGLGPGVLVTDADECREKCGIGWATSMTPAIREAINDNPFISYRSSRLTHD